MNSFSASDMARRCSYLYDAYGISRGIFEIGGVSIERSVYEDSVVSTKELVVTHKKAEVLVHESRTLHVPERTLMFPGLPEKGLVRLTAKDYLVNDDPEGFFEDLESKESRGEVIIFNDALHKLTMPIGERVVEFVPGAWCSYVNKAYLITSREGVRF